MYWYLIVWNGHTKYLFVGFNLNLKIYFLLEAGHIIYIYIFFLFYFFFFQGMVFRSIGDCFHGFQLCFVFLSVFLYHPHDDQFAWETPELHLNFSFLPPVLSSPHWLGPFVHLNREDAFSWTLQKYFGPLSWTTFTITSTYLLHSQWGGERIIKVLPWKRTSWIYCVCAHVWLIGVNQCAGKTVQTFICFSFLFHTRSSPITRGFY